MKIAIEPKDYVNVTEEIKRKLKSEVKKEVDRCLGNIVVNFENNPRLRKYLWALIREVVREELKYAK